MTNNLWIRLKRGITLLGWIILGIFQGFLIFAFILAGEIYEYQDSVDGVHLPEVDAIVVLAGGRGRIATAGDLWFRYWENAQEQRTKPPVLYFSGVGALTHFKDVTHQVRRGVMETLKPEYVVLENKSENTVENAEEWVAIAKERKWNRMLLVTSSYHMLRAKWIFETILKQEKYKAEIATLSVLQDPYEPREWRYSYQGIRVTLMEYFKWIYYRYLWTYV